LELLHGTRYSSHDNPVERTWTGLKNYVANGHDDWPPEQRPEEDSSR
jgi:hypothetical protein